MQNYKGFKSLGKSTLIYFTGYECTKIFPKEELYSLTNQLRRSASSVPANKEEIFQTLFKLINEVKGMLIALINKVRS